MSIDFARVVMRDLLLEIYYKVCYNTYHVRSVSRNLLFELKLLFLDVTSSSFLGC